MNEVLYSIPIEFVVCTYEGREIKMIKMCLNEMYGKVHKDNIYLFIFLSKMV
jgi:hypothetical protein